MQHLLMGSLPFLEWCFFCFQYICLSYLAGKNLHPTLLHPISAQCSSPTSLHSSLITSKPPLQCHFLVEDFVDLPELKLTHQVTHLL